MRTGQPHSFNQSHDVHPSVVKKTYDAQNVWDFEHEWHSKLCDCKPRGRCCFACFCCCCMGCKIAKYLGESTLIGCFPCSMPYMRTKIRVARRIKGSCCGDMCTSECCLACTATQIAAELESQGMWEQPKPKKTKQPRNDRAHQYNDRN